MWLKYLKDCQDHKSGEIVEANDAVGQVLVDHGIAEKTSQPAAVTAGVDAQVAGIATKITGAIHDQLATQIKSLTDGLTGAIAPKTPAHITTHDNEMDDPTLGYKSHTDFYRDVNVFATRSVMTDGLKKAMAFGKSLSNYSAEATGADGGFLVPPEHSRRLMELMLNEEALLPLCDQYQTTGNQVTFPKDETTPWSSDGIQAYWTAEAGTVSDSKPKLGELTIQLHKLAALCPVTNEMLEDSSVGLGGYLDRKAAEKMRNKINTAILTGNGTGTPYGFLTNSSLPVSVAKETSQTAATVNATNIAKMFARLPASSASRAVWLYHPTVFSQFPVMTVGQVPVWQPGSSIQNAPYGTIFGRRLIPTQGCAALGTVNDLILADLSQYIIVTKATGMKSDMSIHLYFDRDITAFRFVFRVGGQPWNKSAITLQDGSTTVSPFVTLATRS